MATNDISMNVADHGVALDDKKKKVKCNYCGKVVSGFYRLKCHIGSVGKDVKPCSEVPPDIKGLFNTFILEAKRRKLVKEVDHLEHPNLRLKRILDPALENTEGVQRIKRGPKPKDPMKQAKEYVNMVKESWSRTGCSLLVENWVDERGRELVNVLVDCPKGKIYMRCHDFSAFVDDIDAWKRLLEEVTKEVGAQNVVQIITSSLKSPMLLAIGQIAEQQHRNIYWALSASHCIGIVLQHMAMVDPFREILNKGKAMVDFIHGHETTLKMFRVYSGGHDLAKPHRISSVKRLLTLENIVSQKQNLKEMFDSHEWIDSTRASSTEGKRAADLLSDHSFWERATILLEATRPFVRMLNPINGTAGNNNLQVGFVYERFRQAKEDIRNQLIGNTTYHYMPFWNVIDEIWDKYLHTPLHSAGYYLNPYLSSRKNFYIDSEAEVGIKCCIDSIVDDPGVQALISQQLEEYKLAIGDLTDGRSFREANSDISPVEWWFRYGGKWPELQRLALRVLCQTCDGALSYGVRRSLAKRSSQTEGIIMPSFNVQ